MQWTFKLAVTSTPRKDVLKSEMSSILVSDTVNVNSTLLNGALTALPFKTLRHQVRLVGVHDEGKLIDEVLGLNEALKSANHSHLAVFQHDHGQEWVRVLPQGLRHYKINGMQ